MFIGRDFRRKRNEFVSGLSGTSRFITGKCLLLGQNTFLIRHQTHDAGIDNRIEFGFIGLGAIIGNDFILCFASIYLMSESGGWRIAAAPEVIHCVKFLTCVARAIESVDGDADFVVWGRGLGNVVCLISNIVTRFCILLLASKQLSGIV